MILAICYPFAAITRFDEAYFRSHHLPLVREKLGEWLASVHTISFGQGAPYRMMTLLGFANSAALDAALASPGMADLQDDLPAFTDCQPEAHFGVPDSAAD